MNNVAKFEVTRKAVETFKEKTEYLFEEAEEKQERKGVFSKVYQKAFFKALQTIELSIDIKRDLVSFESPFGSYMQPIHVKKRRVNVVPLCFLVELYKAGIKDIPEAKASEIPFTLKGFWSMEKAADFVNNLYALSVKSNMKVCKYLNYNNLSNEQKEELNNVLQAIQALDASRDGIGGYGHIRIKYKDEEFKLNLYNVKLDVVPLCKMVTKYYVEVMSVIDSYQSSTKERNALTKVQGELTSFMERYFASRIPF